MAGSCANNFGASWDLSARPRCPDIEAFEMTTPMMTEASLYWSPVCDVVMQLRCWLRVAVNDELPLPDEWRGTMLIIPTPGYLEGPAGPWPIRVIDSIEIATMTVTRRRDEPRVQFLDIKDELLTRMRATDVVWELRETTWSNDGFFAERPITVVHIPNPFRQGRGLPVG